MTGQMFHSTVPTQIDTLDDVRSAIAILTARDKVLYRIHDEVGLPDLRRQPAGLPSLMFMITEQMISLAAAAAIWKRVEERFSPFIPDQLASVSKEEYMACGLSGAKSITMQHLSSEICSGRLDLENLHDLDDNDAISRLKSVKGIGDWTAEVYLLACLGRPDVWPAGDIALRTAVQHAFGFSERPTVKAMREIAEPWRPLRAVGARLLWSYYRKIKGIS